jgi:hypothetical protein
VAENDQTGLMTARPARRGGPDEADTKRTKKGNNHEREHQEDPEDTYLQADDADRCRPGVRHPGEPCAGLGAGMVSRPSVEAFWSQNHGKTLYRVSMPTNSKRLIFNAEELASLGAQIRHVLGGTDLDRPR